VYIFAIIRMPRDFRDHSGVSHGRRKPVILNANVLHDGDESQQVRPQAIAIDAGRIRAVGSNEQVALLADSSTLVLDLAGKTVLAGLSSTVHVHFTQTGLGSLGPQVYGVTSRDAVLQVAADAVGKLAPGQPLLLHGCCFHDLDSPLSLADLDRLAPVNP